MSHNHFHSSVSSALKVSACTTLSIVTIVSPPYLSSNLRAFLESALVKIIPFAVFQIRLTVFAFTRYAFANSTHLHIVEVLVKLLDDPTLCTLLAPRSACWLLPPSCALKLWLVLPTPPGAW